VGVFYLCLHTVGLVMMEVVWVCFGVLFFISEFHFLFLLIFILFWLACIYLCCWCFHLGVYFNVCLFAYLFRLYSLFVFIYFFIIDLYENKKCELNYFNYNFTRLYIRYYEKFSRIQRIQSISKQTEYDNLVLEQDILSKKK
jgi:hypothetical protein